MRNVILMLMAAMLLVCVQACKMEERSTSTEKEAKMQETLSHERLSQVGMPSVKNFREAKLLKDIYELRDQDGLVTYTYLWSDMQGKIVFFCNSIGYGIPYATQFTNPMRIQSYNTHWGVTLPQSDPNGLFSPSGADGTWVMCKDPKGDKVRPVLVEPRAIVSPFKLH